MAEPKTRPTKASVKDFLNAVPDENKRKDSLVLLKLFKKITGEKPVMWGTAIVGFGTYHYKSPTTSREGNWMMGGFSPRKQNLTIYVMGMYKSKEFDALFKKLGKHKISGGACLYINRLSDVDMKVLEQIIKKSFAMMKKKYKT